LSNRCQVSVLTYFPLFEGVTSNNIQMLAVRTTSDPLQFSLLVQRQIAALDPELPVSDVLTMDQVIGESLGFPPRH
jgi:hypothetical protein